MNIIIMRGIPGAGKSTWVKRNHPGALVFSADAYFVTNGEYKFDPARLPEAHGQCFKQYLETLVESGMTFFGYNTLVVDNTNTELWQLSPYFMATQAYKYPVKVVTLVRNPVAAHRANVHGVPEGVVWRMYHRMEPLGAQWNEEVVFVDN